MKVFSRLGTQPMKFTFSLEGLKNNSFTVCIHLKYFFYDVVRDVVLPLIRGLNEGDLIHLSMERGSKSSDGEEVPAGAISSIGDMKTEFNQTLTLGVTLFKDSKGKYQVLIDIHYNFTTIIDFCELMIIGKIRNIIIKTTEERFTRSKE